MAIISGIHNYCDKWCERCPMTAHCAVFEPVADAALQIDHAHDETGAALEYVAASLTDALDLLREWAKRNGLDPDAPVSEAELAAEAAEADALDQHPLFLAARRYSSCVRDWFELAGPDLEARALDLQEAAEAETDVDAYADTYAQSDAATAPDAETGTAFAADVPRTPAEDLAHCVEVIQWHHTVIAAKLRRALAGRDHFWPGEPSQSDSNGSAKVALLCLNQSLQAWARLHSHLPAQEDEIADFQDHLRQTRDLLNSTFPNAMAFHRPGFDDCQRLSG